MFDGSAQGAEFAAIVRDYVARGNAELLRENAELRGKLSAYEKMNGRQAA